MHDLSKGCIWYFSPEGLGLPLIDAKELLLTSDRSVMLCGLESKNDRELPDIFIVRDTYALGYLTPFQGLCVAFLWGWYTSSCGGAIYSFSL